jgi:hypothetical protein
MLNKISTNLIAPMRRASLDISISSPSNFRRGSAPQIGIGSPFGLNNESTMQNNVESSDTNGVVEVLQC